jgi:hypothetical protein
METNEQLWELVQKLFDNNKELKQENTALIELLLKQSGALREEVRAEISQEPIATAIGKEPWYKKKARLEQEHRKPKLSEVSGIPESLVEDHGECMFGEGYNERIETEPCDEEGNWLESKER